MGRLPKGLSVVTVPKLKIGKLYDTNIVLVNQETGIITLNTGGWYTRHTKKCMNLILAEYGLYVKQVKSAWFVMRQDAEVGFFAESQVDIKL